MLVQSFNPLHFAYVCYTYYYPILARKTLSLLSLESSVHSIVHVSSRVTEIHFLESIYVHLGVQGPTCHFLYIYMLVVRWHEHPLRYYLCYLVWSARLLWTITWSLPRTHPSSALRLYCFPPCFARALFCFLIPFFSAFGWHFLSHSLLSVQSIELVLKREYLVKDLLCE